MAGHLAGVGRRGSADRGAVQTDGSGPTDSQTAAGAGGSVARSCRHDEGEPCATVAWHRDGALKLEELVSGVYPLERINDAIAEVKRGEAIRNVIAMRDLGSP